MTIIWRKISVLVFIFTAFIWSPICHADVSTTDIPLTIDAITQTQPNATSDNTYAHGWKWNIDVTIPDSEAALRVKLSDWNSDSGSIDPFNNTRFYSAESINAPDEVHAISSAKDDFGQIIFISTSTLDRDPSTPGIQVRIVAEMKIPSGTKAGSYSGNFSLRSEPMPFITLNEQPVRDGINIAYGVDIFWRTEYFRPDDIITIELWDTRNKCGDLSEDCQYGWDNVATTSNSGNYQWQAGFSEKSGYFGTTSDKVYKLRLVAHGSSTTDSNAIAETWSDQFAILEQVPSIDISHIPNTSPKPGDDFVIFGQGFLANENSMRFFCPRTDPTMEYSIDHLASPNGLYFEFTFPTNPNYTDGDNATTTPCFLTVNNVNGTTTPPALIYLTIDSSVSSTTANNLYPQ
ncbi:MAG: hypothetical protein M1459_01855 [Patescibacteria group bacterium]|nr:hypothetical protein [Patescibacteria group bacterium]